MRQPILAVLLTSLAVGRTLADSPPAQGFNGYYRDPVLHGDTLVFAAEGDLWKVPISGGTAQRLTTHAAEESHPVISPDGTTLAFTARYEGPAEVYTMPLAGGLPVRRTFEGDGSVMTTTFKPSGELVYATQHYSTLPDLQLIALDLTSQARERIPLSQASEGSFDDSGKTLYFVRPAFHNNVTRWYTGGQARQVWKFRAGGGEAEKLTRDHKGESHTPMWWQGRVYFVTDRDRTMNLWSMNDAGGDLQQHTDHRGWDVRHASLQAGRIAYSVGADVWIYDIAANTKRIVPISLVSDLDQLREKWVTKPMEHITSAHLSPKGDAVVLTARGRVFVAPAKSGRIVQASRKQGVRYRDVVFMPDGKTLLGLSDASGELEFVQLPVNGIGAERALTADGKVLRFRGEPSPDGRYVAYHDNNNDAWVLNVRTRAQTKISTNREGTTDFAWSPDSRYLAFGQYALNSFLQLHIFEPQSGRMAPLTSDRVNSFDPAWSPNGDWIYFLSDRNLTSVIGAPWGPRQPEPYFDKPDKIYQVALRQGLRPPFKPFDELSPDGDAAPPSEDEPETPPDETDRPDEREQPQGRERSSAATQERERRADVPSGSKADAKSGSAPQPVRVDFEGLAERIYEVPAPAGDYNALMVSDKALYWLARDSASDQRPTLMVLEITNETPKAVKFSDDVRTFELSGDGKKLLMRKNDDLYVVDAGVKAPGDLPKSKVDLSAWSYSIDVREDWRQLFIDAWRLERDYFYDPNMHGVGWERVRDKYLPLVDRVTTRAELSDLIGLAVGELSALHTAVRDGDMRRGDDNVRVATLGARLELDRRAGGYRIDHIYRTDPDYPQERSPLADPQLNIGAGDVITMINGVDILSAPHPNALLRNQSKQQVLLRVKPRRGGPTRDVVVTPIENEWDLRYSDWEYTRRLETDRLSDNKIGYLHLRAMTGADITAWFRNFYPVFNRPGLIIDARHNRGGNIDSFLLARLLRKDWMYWKSRVGEPYTNMQYAFRGHLVVLVDENTQSDGEAFAEGVKRLGLGKVIGVRTWGGEIWLDSSNRLSDGGFARAPMSGVYGKEGKWLIEQHGVDPDIVVENLPHATFNGSDAQLETAVKELLRQIAADPRPMPQPPEYPRVMGN